MFDFITGFEESNIKSELYKKFNGFKVVTDVPDGSGEYYSDSEIILKALEKDLFSIKSYMSCENVLDSHILAKILRYSYYYKHTLNLDINDILIGICLLYNTLDANTETCLPDKKLSQSILHTNRQNCHKLFFKLQKDLEEYITLRIEPITNKIKIRINKKKLESDKLIVEISKYLKPRQVKKVLTRKEKKVASKKLLEKYKNTPWDKINTKRHNLYYENENRFNANVAREQLKIISIGIGVYYTELVKEFINPEELNDIENITNGRKDIMYMLMPFNMISNITGISEQELRTRMNITVRSIGNLMYRHKFSYANILSNSDESFKTDNQYMLKPLLNRGLNMTNLDNQISNISNEQYYANLQKFPVANNSYIVSYDYFKTKIGKIILENRDTILYIIKNYLTYLYENDIKDDNFYVGTLNKAQLDTVLMKLSDIKLSDSYLKHKAAKLINKDKLSSLPKIKMRDKVEYNFNSCIERNSQDRIIKKDGVVPKNLKYKQITTGLNDTKYFTKRCSNELKLYTEEEIKEEYKDTNKIKDPVKCLFIYKRLLSQFDTEDKLYNLNYNLKQIKLLFNHLKTGFKKEGKQLLDFLYKIRLYQLGSHFINCEEAKPYLKYII